MESLRFGRHASASPATQVGLAALSQPGSHMGAEVILLDLNAISARKCHFWSLYTSVMLTFEHYPRRIFTRHALQPNRMQGDFAGEYHYACVTLVRVCSHWLERKFLAEYGKAQSHKGNCRCSRHCLGESSDISSRLRSNLDGEVELCHSNSRVGQ